MKVGDTVKLISNPSVEWMKDYLDKRFEIQDFIVDCLKIKMADTDPEWVWYAAKDNFELVEGEE